MNLIRTKLRSHEGTGSFIGGYIDKTIHKFLYCIICKDRFIVYEHLLSMRCVAAAAKCAFKEDRKNLKALAEVFKYTLN